MVKQVKKANLLKRSIAFCMAIALSLSGMPISRVFAEDKIFPAFVLGQDIKPTRGSGGELKNGSNQYIYFGSYPKTQVNETDALKSAKWDTVKSKAPVPGRGNEEVKLMSDLRAFYDGDEAEIGGVKYRRIDMNFVDRGEASEGTNPDYRYFKYEPIRWRILENNYSSMKLMADDAIDFKQYCAPIQVSENNPELADITYEDSDIVEWLSGFSDTGTEGAIFYNYAFSDLERSYVGSNEKFTGKNKKGSWFTFVNLPGLDDIRNPSYGFNTKLSTPHNSKQFARTDYASLMREYWRKYLNAGDKIGDGILLQQLNKSKITEILNSEGVQQEQSYDIVSGVSPIINVDRSILKFASSVPVKSSVSDLKEITDSKALYPYFGFSTEKSDINVTKENDQYKINLTNDSLSFEITGTKGNQRVVICAYGSDKKSVKPYYAVAKAPAKKANDKTVTFKGDFIKLFENYYITVWVENEDGSVASEAITIIEPSVSSINDLSKNIKDKISLLDYGVHGSVILTPGKGNCDIVITDVPVNDGGAAFFKKRYSYYANKKDDKTDIHLGEDTGVPHSIPNGNQINSNVIIRGLDYNTEYELGRTIGKDNAGITDKISFKTPAYPWKTDIKSVTASDPTFTTVQLKLDGDVNGSSFVYAEYDSKYGTDFSAYKNDKKIRDISSDLKIKDLAAGKDYKIIIWQQASAEQIKDGYEEKSIAIKSGDNDYFSFTTKLPDGKDFAKIIPEAPEVESISGDENGNYTVTLNAKDGYEYAYTFSSKVEADSLNYQDSAEFKDLSVAKMYGEGGVYIDDNSYKPVAYFFARKKAKDGVKASLVSEATPVIFIPTATGDGKTQGYNADVSKDKGYVVESISPLESKINLNNANITKSADSISISGLKNPKGQSGKEKIYIHAVATGYGDHTESTAPDALVVAAKAELSKNIKLEGLIPGEQYIIIASTVNYSSNISDVAQLNEDIKSWGYRVVLTDREDQTHSTQSTDYVKFGDYMAPSNVETKKMLQDKGINYSVETVYNSKKGTAFSTNANYHYGYCQREVSKIDSNPAKLQKPAFLPAVEILNTKVISGTQEITIKAEPGVEYAIAKKDDLTKTDDLTFETLAEDNEKEVKLTVQEDGTINGKSFAPGEDIYILSRTKASENNIAGSINTWDSAKVAYTAKNSDENHKLDLNSINELKHDLGEDEVVLIPKDTLSEGTQLKLLKETEQGLQLAGEYTAQNDKPVWINISKLNSMQNFYLVMSSGAFTVPANTTLKDIANIQGLALSQRIAVAAKSAESGLIKGRAVFDQYLNSATMTSDGTNVNLAIDAKDGYVCRPFAIKNGVKYIFGEVQGKGNITIAVADIKEASVIGMEVENASNPADFVTILYSANSSLEAGATLEPLTGDNQLMLYKETEAQNQVIAGAENLALEDKSEKCLPLMYKPQSDVNTKISNSNSSISGLKENQTYNVAKLKKGDSNKAESVENYQGVKTTTTVEHQVAVEENGQEVDSSISIELGNMPAREARKFNLTKDKSDITDIISSVKDFNANLDRTQGGDTQTPKIMGSLKLEGTDPEAKIDGQRTIKMRGLLDNKGTILTSGGSGSGKPPKKEVDIDLDKERVELVGKYKTKSGKEIFAPFDIKSTDGDTIEADMPMRILDKDSQEFADLDSVVQVADDKPEGAKSSLDPWPIVLTIVGVLVVAGGVTFAIIYYRRKETRY